VLKSVIGIKTGDTVKFTATGGGGGTVYKKITAIDESAKKISWSGSFSAGPTLAIDDVVSVPGFTVQVYYKSINGIETEVDTDLGKIICSSEPEVTEYYVENIFKSSKYVQITEASGSTLGDRLPANDAAVTYPTSGADGTAVATVEAQAYFLEKFKSLPVRWLANPETTSEDMQKDLIRYALSRDDTPIVIVNIASDRTKDQLKAIGNAFQRSDFYPGLIWANWLKVPDPFSNSVIAPYRSIPNVGHVMGLWIRTIGLYGVHVVPALNDIVLNGVSGVVGEQFLDDDDRTQIADCGVNLIQEKVGVGIKCANAYTLSTATEYLFGNIILMRNYIKISCQDSLADSENTPNSLNRIKSDKMRIVTWLYKLWDKGSTGNGTAGETFGQVKNADGKDSGPDDHFLVIADNTNNPQEKINLGERNFNIYHTAPAPAGSIVIGVGVYMK